MAINSVSFWKQNQIWRERQQALSDQLDTMTALTEEMSNAGADLAYGYAELAAKAAAKRVSEATKLKQQEVEAAAAKVAAEEKAMDALEQRLKIPDYIKALAAKVNFTV
jgi:hypothetical protein